MRHGKRFFYSYKKPIISLICIVLCLTLIIPYGMPTTLYASNDLSSHSFSTKTKQYHSANSEKKRSNGKKSETVFVTLDPSGHPTETIVTNRLQTDAGEEIEDATTLTDIVPIKGGELVREADGILTWKAKEKDVYYQGKTNQPLPLSVEITYFLNGKEMEPEELAGRSGELEITLSLENHLKKTVMVQNKPVTMMAPLNVVIGMVLPDNVFHNVEISDGSVTGDGNNQIVSILAMPGLEESLRLKAYDIPGLDELDFPSTFTISADVTEFEMGPIAIGVSTDFPEMDVETKEIEDMRTSLGDLQKIQNDLSASDSDRQIRSIFMDPWMSRGAQIMVDDIFAFYDMDKRAMEILPDYITKENIELYDRVKENTEGLDLEEALVGETGDAVFDFLEAFSIDKARLLMDKKEGLKSLSNDYKHLLDNDDAESVAMAAADLAQAVRSSPKEAAALLALTKHTQSFTQLYTLYQKSGLGSLNPNDIEKFLALYESMQEMGISEIDPAKLSQILQFYRQSGLAESPQMLEMAMKQIQSVMQSTGGAFSGDEWATFIEAGLQAVVQGRMGGQKGSLDTDVPDAEIPEEQIPEPEGQDGTSDSQVENGETPQDSQADSTDTSTDNTSTDPADTSEADPADSSTDDTETDDTDTQDSSSTDKASDSTESETASEQDNDTEIDAGQASRTDQDETNLPQKDTNKDDTASSKVVEQADGAASPKAESVHSTPLLFDPILRLAQKPLSEVMVSFQSVPTQPNQPIKIEVVRQLLQALEAEKQSIAQTMAAYGINPNDPIQMQSLVQFSSRLSEEAKYMMSQMQALSNDKKAEKEMDRLLDRIADGRAFSKIRGLRSVMEDNERNLELAEDLLNNRNIDLDIYKEIKGRSKVLRKDIKDIHNVFKYLRADLDDEGMQESLHNAPETVETLMKMKDDLETYRKVTDALSKTVAQENIDMFANMFSTLDRLEAEGSVDRYVGQVDDILELLARKDAYVEMAKQNTIFTGAPNGFETKVKYVMKTDEIEIKKPEKESVLVEEEPKGLWQRIKKRISSLKR